MEINRRVILGSAAGLAMLGAPGAAEMLDDATIVVTSQRQAYRGDFTLRETPQAITQIGQL